MGILLNYKEWTKLYEASFEFDPSGNYPDPTFGLPTGGVDSGKVVPGGAGGDWDGSMQRALAFGKVANEFMGKNVISSQKRKRVKTASGRTSDHFNGQDFTYAVDLSCSGSTGDSLLAYLMNWFGHPEYTGGSWFNVIKDGYRYQIGWRVPNHFNHIHVGVKKVDAADQVSRVNTTLPANTSASAESQVGVELEKIKSGYKLLKSGMKGEDIREIQKKLKEKGLLTKEPNGEFDKDTYNAVKTLQTANSILIDGIVGPQTYGVLYGVKPDDAAIARSRVERGKLQVVSGDIKSSYTGEKAQNIDLLIKTMEENGITNPYSKVGILATIGKETNFIPKSENLNYSKERLPEVWAVFSKTGKVVSRGQGKDNYNELAVEYEHNPEKLANFVYGQKPYGMRTNAFGNTQPEDGWKYRGRGFNGVTFKGSYEKYARSTGLDLVANPDLLNDTKIAAKVAVDFLVNGVKNMGKDPNSFTSVDQAVSAFVAANAGGNPVQIQMGLIAANKIIPNFSVATA